MATVTNITYAADAALANTAWESIANGVFASSAVFDNSTTTKFVDVMVGGRIASSTTGTPVVGDTYDIYVAGSYDTDITGGFGGGIDALLIGDDGTLLADADFVLANLKLLTVVSVEATTPDVTQDYIWGPVSIASAFGGIMPAFFLLVLHNNTAGTLTTGNDINTVGITYTHT